MNTNPIETLSYTDSGHRPGTLYYYAVTSVDGDGDESSMSIAVTPAVTSHSSSRIGQLPAACFVRASHVDTGHSHHAATLIFPVLMVSVPGWVRHLFSREKIDRQ